MENQVRELRKQKKLTQQEVAQVLSVSRQTVIASENGKDHPPLGLAVKSGRVMELPLETSFFYKEDENE